MGYDIHCIADYDEQGELIGEWKRDFHPPLKDFTIAHDSAKIPVIDIPPGCTHLFRTGFEMAIQPGWGCLFWDRSGMGGKKLVHRFAGVIDSSYRGEWLVRLYNFSDVTVRIGEGDRIVQGIFQEQVEAQFPLVDTLPESDRGAGGFGSTGN